MKTLEPISVQTLKRLPLYYSYLKVLPKDGPVNISATTLAKQLGLHDVQVRKDLACISKGGKPKIGYRVEDLIADIGRHLGYDDMESAVLVGASNLGCSLMNYKGFAFYGLDIVAAFDKEQASFGNHFAGKPVFPLDKLKNLCQRMKIKIGIITVPAEEAQAACNLLVKSGVLAIWNFSSATLQAPETVLVRNENLKASLALLTKHVAQTAC